MNTQTQEALKMAIEALDTLMIEKGSIYQQALKACKEALEQPAQEPVAWMELKEDAGYTEITVWQEPISKKSIPLYTHPAPSWQGLSNDRIRDIGDNCLEHNNGLFNWIDFARAIEQALKEKNHG